MKRFRGKGGRSNEPDPDAQSAKAVGELLDRHHQRASISEGDRLIVEPGKVLDNITMAMERLDLDIDTPISIEEDVASLDEVAALIGNLRFGPLLAVHVVNTAMRIMSARYPAELVRRPLPEQYDIRKLAPLKLTDREQDTAKSIFNQRTVSAVDLDEDDVADALEPLGRNGQIQVFVTLIYMYGTKIGAMKHRTGIE